MELPLPLVPYTMLYPDDMLEGIDVDNLSEELRSRFNCEVWKLDGALAFCLREILVTYGQVHDYPKYRTITDPLYAWLTSMGVDTKCATIDFKMPFPTYGVRVLIPWKELEAERYCCSIRTKLKSMENIAFRLTSPYALTDDDKIKLRTIVESWLQHRKNEALFGEKLNLGEVNLTEYLAEATPKSYREEGFLVQCSECQPCTWPWIELYLKMRSMKFKRQRLSIMFCNT